MFFKEGKRFLAGLCVCSMLFTSVAENTLLVTAAEVAPDVAETVAAEETGGVSGIRELDGIEIDTGIETYAEEDEPTNDGDDYIVGTDDYTFESATGILTFKKDLVGIGDGQFLYVKDVNEGTWWDDIKEIQFEEGSKLKLIGNRSFKGLPNLERIDFSNCSKLTYIYSEAFYGCTKVSEVTFPDELVEIQASAFFNCKQIETITLNPKLATMGNGVFNGCSELSTVIVETNNLTCGTNIFSGCDISDIQFVNNNTVVPSNLFNGATFADGAQIVIPYFIQEIGAGAFNNCKTLVSVTLEDTEEHPSALASIAKEAFKNCSALASVTFPSSVKVIEASAYEGCSALTSVIIPNTVTVLGASAFKNCKQVSTLQISNTVSSLGASVFEGCESLTEVVVPSGIGEISASMFRNCTSMWKITIPSTVKAVGNNAFEGCVALLTIELPNTVTTVGASAFKGCARLDNPHMPKDLDTYANNLFENCNALEIISTSEKEGDREKGLEIPEAVVTIGSKAFANCDSIEHLFIPKNVTTIQQGAFSDCQIIGTVKIDTLQLTTCGNGIFAKDALEEIIFPEGITEIPAKLFSQAGFRTDAVITIPATVTKIGQEAFGGNSATNNTNISSIVFEEGSQLTTIENQAFRYCTVITEFTIPETVTKIGTDAFRGCEKLMSITIPEKVTEIGAAAFMDCEVLTTVNFNAIEVRTSNQNIFRNCNIHTILIGEKVTILPAYLFYGAKFSTNSGESEIVYITLTIPASVGEIGEYAFSNITNLSKVYFAEGSSLKTVGTYAFNECTALTKCSLPDGVESIGNAAFRGCTKLEEMKIPASLVTLGNYAFYQCSLVEEYVIPANVTAILDNTFYANTSLKSITFEGYNISQIGANAFADCTKLEAVDIPSGTTSIGDYAFSGDSALTEVRIPSSVSEIGVDAFKGCTNAVFYVVKGSYAETWLMENGFTSQIKNMNTITYVLDGGENDIRNIGGYRDGDTFTFYDATKPGYSFDGWYLEDTFQTKVTDLTGRSGDFTLYAKWIEGVYKITYELDGGVNDESNPTTYTYYDNITFAVPTKVGHGFKGWYLDSEFKKQITSIKAGEYSKDITLYAKWQPNQWQVTFVDESRKGKIVPNTPYNVVYGSVYGKDPQGKERDLPTATRENYLFDGWYTEDGVLITKDSLVTIDKAHKLYAKWVLDVRVEAPVADIESGTRVEKGTKVILSTETPGAEIYYNIISYSMDGEDATSDGADATNDGVDVKSNDVDFEIDLADPTTGSTRYTGPITIDENTVIKAIGVKDGFKNSEVSTFVYTVKDETVFWGDITEEDRAQFKNGDEVPDGIWIAGVKDTVYTGSAIKFDVRVYSHKTLLTEKKDYTIKYSNNKAAANKTDKKAPTVTVTGKGNYKGKDTVKFNIIPVDINSASIEADTMWVAVKAGKTQMPVPVVTFGKTKLKNKKDFQIVGYYDEAGKAVSGCSSEGVYTIEIRGLKNFAGPNPGDATNTRKIQCVLTTANLMSKAKVTCAKSVPYNNGEEVKPPVTVKFGGATLVEGTNYTVEYKNNKEVGTATAIVTGLKESGYVGTKKVTFKIAPTATINKAQITINPVTYKGSPYTVNDAENPLKINASYQGIALKEGVDYVIDSYSKNTDVGKGTVVFRGINKFSGTVKKTFKINAVDINTLSLKFVDADGNQVSSIAAPYTKGGAKPKVYLEYNGRVLKAGTDYTVSYKNNKKLGSASLTIKGKKNFKGTKKNIPFTIKAQDISNLSIVVPDIVAQKEAGNYKVKPVITDLDGKKLSSGKDYKAVIEYTYAYDCMVWEVGGNLNGEPDKIREAGKSVMDSDILPVGTTLKATVYATESNYTGKIEGLYTVVLTGTIDKAKVKIAPQQYTGKAIQPGKGKGGIEEVKVGNTILTEDQYEIVGYSNNVARGNATVTLQGTGEYGGTITVKFKIVQRNMLLYAILEKLGLM